MTVAPIKIGRGSIVGNTAIASAGPTIQSGMLMNMPKRWRRLAPVERRDLEVPFEGRVDVPERQRVEAIPVDGLGVIGDHCLGGVGGAIHGRDSGRNPPRAPDAVGRAFTGPGSSPRRISPSARRRS